MEGEQPVPRILNVALGEISLRALREECDSEASGLGAPLERAIRYYLTDKDSGRPGWAYPRFRLNRGGGDGVQVRISIDDAPWDALEREAERQGVSAEQLVEHAALYFAADLDNGRLARRERDGDDLA